MQKPCQQDYLYYGNKTEFNFNLIKTLFRAFMALLKYLHECLPSPSHWHGRVRTD